MKAIFYRSKYGTWLSKLIDFWTGRDGFSHSEICFSKEATLDYIKHLEDDQPALKRLCVISAGQLCLSGEEFFTVTDRTCWYLEDDKLREVVKTGNLRLCFSASEQDKCVRMKLINIKPERWACVECEGDLGTEKEGIEWCEGQVGRGYDYVGVLGFILRHAHIVQPSNKNDWCSETTENGLYEADYLPFNWLIGNCMPPSPNALWRKLSKLRQPLLRQHGEVT